MTSRALELLKIAGEAKPAPPTLAMRAGSVLAPLLRAAKEMFPKDNPRGRALGEFLLGSAPDSAEKMKEGYTNVLGNFRGRPVDWRLNSRAVDMAGAVPISSAAKILGALGKEAALAKAITVFHGSPHKFDKFDMSKIGTGEGAQAYGHGLYFAESPEVAKGYRDTLARPSGVKVHGEFKTKLDDAEALAAGGLWYSKGDYEAAIKDLDEVLRPNVPDDVYKKARSLLESRAIEHGGVGNLYHVDIPDDQIEKMLDWDKPLSEQPEHVQKALSPVIDKSIRAYKDTQGNERYMANIGNDQKPFPTAEEARAYLLRNMDGATAYLLSGNPAQSSNLLAGLGIPGIKYLDAGSRGQGSGTRNFVLFDDSIPKIIKKE